MRSMLLLVGVAAVAGWAVVTQLPASEAQAALAPRPTVSVDIAGPKPIESVAIDGDNLPLAVLRDVLVTKPGAVLDPLRLAEDRTALERALEARGYLAAHVDPADVSYAGGSAFVTFPVEQGAVFKVRSIRVTGANERDAGVVTLAVGDPAIEARIEHARQLLADHLARRGKPKNVTVSVTRDERAAAVDVELIAL